MTDSGPRTHRYFDLKRDPTLLRFVSTASTIRLDYTYFALSCHYFRWFLLARVGASSPVLRAEGSTCSTSAMVIFESWMNLESWAKTNNCSWLWVRFNAFLLIVSKSQRLSDVVRFYAWFCCVRTRAFYEILSLGIHYLTLHIKCITYYRIIIICTVRVRLIIIYCAHAQDTVSSTHSAQRRSIDWIGTLRLSIRLSARFH